MMTCLLFIVFTVSLISISVTGVTDKDCTESGVDLVIIVDSAPGASDPCKGVKTFEELVGFTKSLLQQLMIESNGTRVSLVSYANTTEVISYLNQHTDHSSMKIQALAYMTYRPTTKNADLALETMRSKVLNFENGDRPDALDLIILLSDGTSEHTALTQALNMVPGSKLFAIEVGASLIESKLFHITPSEVLALNVSFSDDMDILRDFIYYVCQGFKSSNVPLEDGILSDQDEKPLVGLHRKSDISSCHHANLHEHYKYTTFDWPRTTATSAQRESYLPSHRVVQSRTEFVETVLLEYGSNSHLSSGQFESSSAALSGTMEWASRVIENSTLLSSNQFRTVNHSLDTSLLDEGQGQKEKHTSRLLPEIFMTLVARELNVTSGAIISDDVSTLQLTSYVEDLPIFTELSTLLVTSRSDDLSVSYGTPWRVVLSTRFEISSSDDIILLSKSEDLLVISRSEDLSVISMSEDVSVISRSEDLSVISRSEDLSVISRSEDLSMISMSEDVSVISRSEDLSVISRSEDLSVISRSEDLSVISWPGDLSSMLVTSNTKDLSVYSMTAWSKDESSLSVTLRSEDILVSSRSEDLSWLLITSRTHHLPIIPWLEVLSTFLVTGTTEAFPVVSWSHWSEDVSTRCLTCRTEESLILTEKPWSEDVSTLLATGRTEDPLILSEKHCSEDVSTLLWSEDVSTLLWSEDASTLLWSEDVFTLLWSEDVSTLLVTSRSEKPLIVSEKPWSEDVSTLLVTSRAEDPLTFSGKPWSENTATLLLSEDVSTLLETSRTEDPLISSEKSWSEDVSNPFWSEDVSTLLVTSRTDDITTLSVTSKSSDLPAFSYSYLTERGFTSVVPKPSGYKSQDRRTDMPEISNGSLMSQTAGTSVHSSVNSDENMNSSTDANDQSERGGELSGYEQSNRMAVVLTTLLILVVICAAVAGIYRKSLHGKRFEVAEMTSL